MKKQLTGTSKRLAQAGVLALVIAGVSVPSFAETSNSTFSFNVTPPVDPCAGFTEMLPTWAPDPSVTLDDNNSANGGVGFIDVEPGASVGMSVLLNFSPGETCNEGNTQQVLADGDITATWTMPSGIDLIEPNCDGVINTCSASTSSVIVGTALVGLATDGVYNGSVDIVWVPAG